MTTKIALVSSWNAACGVSVHAELIGKEWLKKGYHLKVFAPFFYEHPFPSYVWSYKDEPFVTRNFYFTRCDERYSDEKSPNKKILDYTYFDTSFVNEDFDLFVVERPSSLPLYKLFPIFKKIKKKAKTVAILHEGSLPQDPYFYKLDWDSIVVFDERFKKLFSKRFPPEKLHVIPYPCYFPQKKSQEQARKTLNLKKDKKIILSFGRLDLLPKVLSVIDNLKDHSIKYLCLINSIESYKKIEKLPQKYPFLEIRGWGCPIFSEEFNNFLFAADVIIDYHGSVPYIPVSSQAHICLGFFRPLICPDNSFYYSFKKEVLKYKNVNEIGEKLIEAFERNKKVLKAAEKFVQKNSNQKVAKEILLC